MTALTLSASQTVGPFFHPSLLRADARRNALSTPAAAGERIRIEGSVFDGDGAPVTDALIEIWQADAHGRFRHPLDRGTQPPDPAFFGYGRAGTDDRGRYWFDTIKPGRVPFDARALQAPHVSMLVFARGLLNHLATRLYFDDEPSNEADPVLRLVPAERRPTLLARRLSLESPVTYRFDVILQGEKETVFFNW